ncbi:ABC transporter ATP-binding protein [Methylobacterium sp. NPDC080182]|uniref:ABC transporter ATP-binding protein n=1 Tax=unclassified Methylobacterium TaxID=2615210 RepID=UPI0008A7EF6F|nr:ABC transporter ATP-binding protein [Methylobacterium sp. 275MFSha3.1]SEH79929.1 neutral amino acid transport system ATP-binding protein [Methylobacterium sp. 275MFSha3.1]
MLEAVGVRVRFGGFTALDGVDVAVRAGSITGLVGPNGAGKSTLFDVLVGRRRPQAGAVRLMGRTVTRMPVQRRAQLGLTRTFQISRELGSLTVLENLLLAAPRQPGEAIWNVFTRPGLVRRAEEAALSRADALLARVSLRRLADQPADALSGGQKKLLELCRALMLEPRVVLLDEPAAGVNPVLVGEIADFVRTLRDEGLTFAIVEHNMDLIAALCDPIYVLAEGRVLRHGRFSEIAADDTVAQAYLGGAA